MRRAGCADAHPGDPRLIAALAQGVTVDALAATAAEGAALGKKAAWSIATALGRTLDSKKAQEGAQKAVSAFVGGASRGGVLGAIPIAQNAFKRIATENVTDIDFRGSDDADA